MTGPMLRGLALALAALGFALLAGAAVALGLAAALTLAAPASIAAAALATGLFALAMAGPRRLRLAIGKDAE